MADDNDTGEPSLDWAVTREDLVRLKRLILTDIVALSKWDCIKDTLVSEAAVVRLVEGNLRDHNYAYAIKCTLESWRCTKSATATISSFIDVLRLNQLTSLADTVRNEFIRPDQRQVLKEQVPRKQKQIHYNKPIIFKGTEVSQIDGYTERKGLQDKIIDALSTNAREDRPPGVKMSFNLVNVHGIGGHGKTQLAKRIFELALAKDVLQFDGNVIWIHAESKGKPNGIRDQFQRLLESNGYSATSSQPENLGKVVYGQILKDRECLVVMDNVDDFEEVYKYLPTNGLNPCVNVLLTSKFPWHTDQRGWGKVENIPIGVFSTEEAKVYVRQFEPDIKEEELEAIFRCTSRIPADLSFICHSFKAIAHRRNLASEPYSWDTHLKRYGQVLSTHANPVEVIAGIGAHDYAKSTRENLVCSMNMMAAEDKRVGNLAVYMLKSFSFCNGLIFKKELVHRHPGFKDYAKQKCKAQENEDEKINDALGLLVEFAFIQTREEEEGGVMLSVNDSYQNAIREEVSTRSSNEAGSKVSEKAPRPQKPNFANSVGEPDKQTILLGLIEWVQLQNDLSVSSITQKLWHAVRIWQHIRNDSYLVKKSTETTEFLKAIMIGNNEEIELWRKHCESQDDFITKLLEHESGELKYFRNSALAFASYDPDLTTFEKLVQTVTSHLLKIQEDSKKSGFVEKLKSKFLPASKGEALKSPDVSTEDSIHGQVLAVAYDVFPNWAAIELICNNFPLRYYEPIASADNRTLLHRVVRTEMSVSEVEFVLGLDAKHNQHLPENKRRTPAQNIAFVNHKDSDGHTALHIAAWRSLSGVVEVLLAHGADPEIQQKNGWNALHFTIGGFKQKMTEEEAKIRTEFGEKLGSHDVPFATIYSMCKLYGNSSAFAAPINPSQTHALQSYGEKLQDWRIEYSAIIQTILRHVKSDKAKFVNVQTEEGFTALHVALNGSCALALDNIAFLLDSGANPALLTSSPHRSPLHVALASTPYDVKLVELLLWHGAGSTVSLKDCDGKSPIDYLDEWRNGPDFIPEAREDCEVVRRLLLSARAEAKTKQIPITDTHSDETT